MNIIIVEHYSTSIIRGKCMSKPSYICNCDVIHEDIVNDVKSKMQPKDDYIQLAG